MSRKVSTISKQLIAKRYYKWWSEMSHLARDLGKADLIKSLNVIEGFRTELVHIYIESAHKRFSAQKDFDEYRWLSIAMHAIDNQLQRDTARVSEMIRYEPKLLNAIAATIISAKRERRTDDVAAVIAMLDVDYSYQREICDFSFAVEAYQNLNCYEQYKICDAVKEAVRSDRTLQHKVEQRVEKFGGFITRALTCGVEVAV